MILNKLSKQWYIKFYDIIISFEFKKNTIDYCIYLNVSKSKFIILALQVDNILLAHSDLDLLYEIKIFLTKNFKIIEINEVA